MSLPADATRPHPAGSPIEAWLGAVPAALLLLDAGGVVAWRNPAAAALLGDAATPGRTTPARWLAAAGPWAEDDGSRWLQARQAAAPDGRALLQIDDVTDLVRAQQDAARQQELLDLARDAGRLGIWERDVRTLHGRWDRHVQRFWGLPAGEDTPPFGAVSEQILEEDRQGLEAAFRGSLAHAGAYSHRYRVRRPDGGITHLHSHWAVRDGPDGRPARVVGIMFDDTQSIEATHRGREMASQLSLAEDLTGLLLWRHDLRSDRMQFNRPGYALLGLAPEPLGVPAAVVRGLMHPQDVPAAHEAATRAGDGGGIVDVEVRCRRPDGGWRPVLTRRVLQRDEHGAPLALIGVALDITARHADEQRARELSQRFELATRTAGIGYWSREGDAERADWSEQMRRLHGLAADAPVPTLKEWLSHFVHPQDRASVREKFMDWLSGRAPHAQGEFRIVTPDGRERHVLTHAQRQRDGERPMLFGIAVDVTASRLADAALRRADERAALAARGAGIGTWELDLQTGETHWDDQMWRLRGRAPRARAPDPDELLAFVHPDDLPWAMSHVRGARTATEPINAEFRVVWPDGTVRFLASRSSTLNDAGGRPLRRIGVNWDVTASRLADSERREREAAVRTSQAKSRFLARMSHELRTPLNAVLGFTQLLQTDDDAAQRAQRLAHIRDAGEHLLSLIDDVLELTSLDSGELRVASEAVPLSGLVREALTLVEPMRAARAVTIAVDVGALAVQADRTRLRQVLLNLLSNAIKYNVDAGRVALTARSTVGHVEIAVCDNGCGMAPTQLANLFQPFNRLGAEHAGIEGTGIGLAIVKTLAERMGGRVTVDSTPGKGSRFAVTLPAAAAQAAATPVDRPPVADGADARLDAERGILYIEDNAVNALIVRELLARRPGLRLRIADTGRAGLAMARQALPALVLLDMQLPDMAGLSVLQTLRADPALADLRCVALSANVLPEDIERALAAGASAYWTKPLDLARFADTIDAWFGVGPAQRDATDVASAT